jgi:hypothetical protein
MPILLPGRTAFVFSTNMSAIVVELVELSLATRKGVWFNA